MPTVPQEQLDEIEMTIQDLLDQLEETRKERDAYKLKVQQLLSDRSADVDLFNR